MKAFDLKRLVLSSAALFLCVSTTQCIKKQPSNGKISPSASIDSIGSVKFKDLLGINGFEWEFLGDNNELDEGKANVFKSFGGFRHYLDWRRLETQENVYAYQPSLSGGWKYDDIYLWCKTNGVEVLACIKTVPDWLLATYPPDEMDDENAPIPYGYNRLDPSSYRQFAKLGFQFAARYGNNTQIDTALITVAPDPHWEPNQKKVGLGLIRYIECNNEPDRWWKGKNAHQTAEEYAANLSAFYDGHLGQLGEGIGVKNADSSMQVVMGGLAKGDPGYISRMIAWCRQHRGLNEDGSVNLCFDVINYHHYSFSEKTLFSRNERGKAPELSSLVEVAQQIMKVAEAEGNGLDVWVTELGYDLNQESPLRAIPIKNKTPYITHADWSLRSALLYARLGIRRLHFYMLNDASFYSETQFASSGFVDEAGQRRPTADYFLQSKVLLGEYCYQTTINTDPIVDVYVSGHKKIFVLVIPDEKGREDHYDLEIGDIAKANVHTLQIGRNEVATQVVDVIDGKLKIHVTETPVFIEPLL